MFRIPFLFISIFALLSISPLFHRTNATHAPTVPTVQPGEMDNSFGVGGSITTDFGNFDIGEATAIQADGKIIVAGVTAGGIGGDFILARYNTNGSLDTSFDSDGKVFTDFSGGRGD